ncbi:MAG: SDR family NAD(P)-dependent oxidoreductase [Pseudomonadota bacterium]
MTKTILLTGATDGIGLETARRLAVAGHTLLLHGRNAEKLKTTQAMLAALEGAQRIECYRADLSQLTDVEAMTDAVAAKHDAIDVLINNAGVFETRQPTTAAGDDVRFIVNTVAPYLLTQRLLPLMPSTGRVVNLSSAAQAPVDLQALAGQRPLPANAAYAQSKLAITMWSKSLADKLGTEGPAIIAVNPASFLGSKMVKEAYGSDGKDLGIGADILIRAALSPEFADASGKYFDNDSQRFANPHPDALRADKVDAVVAGIEAVIARLQSVD